MDLIVGRSWQSRESGPPDDFREINELTLVIGGDRQGLVEALSRRLVLGDGWSSSGDGDGGDGGQGNEGD
jgi:hypothetical protein